MFLLVKLKAAHCEGNLRSCGAKTVVVGQSHVRINGKLWAVENDPDDHGGGGLISSGQVNIRINGKKAIVVGDHAFPDFFCGQRGQSQEHCDPIAMTGSMLTDGA